MFCILTFASGCVNQTADVRPEATPGYACTTSDDCVLPMEYAIQSNCPFVAVCHQGGCAVMCPQYVHSAIVEERVSYPVLCKTDTECNCDDRGGKTIVCACIDGQCGSIEKR